MIKTPVKVEVIEGYNVIVEQGNSSIGDFVTTEIANEAAKRINAHDELVNKFERILSICEMVDSWESFPQSEIDAAYLFLESLK